MTRLRDEFPEAAESRRDSEGEATVLAEVRLGGVCRPAEVVQGAGAVTDGHAHAWSPTGDDTQTTRRYACECGARGWQPKFLTRGALGRWGRDEVREYRRPPEPVAPEVTVNLRSAGRNATGGYLPPGTGGHK